MTSEEQYKQELKQSDIDHHTPTAGAMTGHIIANLLIHTLKISQAKFFAHNLAALFLASHADNWIRFEQAEFNRLNQLLVNNGEAIPTTTEQIREFTMLTENGADKYLAGNEQLFHLVQDFDTQILFIKKAIPLAHNEQWPELKKELTNFLTWIKEQIALTQRVLGHEIRTGLYTEDDDNDF